MVLLKFKITPNAFIWKKLKLNATFIKNSILCNNKKQMITVRMLTISLAIIYIQMTEAPKPR